MKKKVGFYGVIVFVLTLVTSPINGLVDKESIFQDAREPASILDLKLQAIRWSWYEIFIKSPKSSTTQKYPLLVRAGVEIELSYYGIDDKIGITGWINKLEGFLTLTPEQRKGLLSEVLSAVEALLWDLSIVDKKTGRPSIFQPKQHIRLNMIVGGVMFNEKGELIRGILPRHLLGTGQAGYVDGEFILSHDYYLHLRVINGIAVPGDAKKFVIEKEQ